ncbi:hypothetical protein M1B72_01065 [Geomonas paludis]|uniref:Uncharacterized protein n=1 Tax=Geomonas paludis TaxID=2740185 RepID=A0A6V8N3D3_9BACT|nr:hypothetical protein [Geomonas paludis]UPU36322.1 hypothetical protein M1B72_01065 [Geomonas paludis]GFO66153.1 hypothetical protein GMPD_40720 [Geomonas paludis]
MDHKTKGVVLGLAGVILWFMPLVNFGFMGIDIYQTGSQVAGISYLLLAASAGYAVLSWFEQHQLRIIAAGIATAIGLLLLVQFGDRAAWGLYLLIVVSGVSCISGYTDEQKRKKSPQQAEGGDAL